MGDGGGEGMKSRVGDPRVMIKVNELNKPRDHVNPLHVLYSTCRTESALFGLGMDGNTYVYIPYTAARWYPNLARAHNCLCTMVREHEGIHTYVSACAAARGYPIIVRRYIRIDSIDTFAEVQPRPRKLRRNSHWLWTTTTTTTEP